MRTSSTCAALTARDLQPAPDTVTTDPPIKEAFAAAVAQERAGQVELAEQAYRRIVERAPHHAQSLHNLGSILKRQGHMDEAQALFRRALTLRPDSCITVYQLTGTQRYENSSHKDARRIRKLLKARRVKDRDAVFLHFSLGKIHNDCGEFDRAFNSYRRGNALMHKGSRFDARLFEGYVNLVIDTFSPALIERLRPFASPSELPVYVIGMPRSGTTLVEQILSAHPLVHGAGELTLVDQAIQNLRKRGNLEEDYPVLARHLSGETLAAEAKDYETFIRSLIDGNAVRFIDKMPYNFKCVGLIMLLFGQARVVHVRRDPRDVCLSNYFQLYVGKHEHVYSLSDLGRYYRQYERLMDHWRSLLDPSRLFEVSYEELVTDTATWAPRLIDFLGLEWDERCLEPHRSERVVHTASTWQVRQPIYTRSIGRWKNYRQYLEPLDRALGQARALAQPTSPIHRCAS